MNCNAFRNRLSAYVDGELSGRSMLEFRRHLADCPACAKEVEAQKQLKRALRGLAGAEPPVGLEDRLVANVLAEPKRRSNQIRTAGWVVAYGAAAALAVLWAFQHVGQRADQVSAKEPAGFDVEYDRVYAAGDAFGGATPVVTAGYSE